MKKMMEIKQHFGDGRDKRGARRKMDTMQINRDEVVWKRRGKRGAREKDARLAYNR